MAFIKDQYVCGWIVDPKGTPTAGWGLTLCPRDMAKIGQLYLNQGVWNGRELVPRSWVTESTREHSRWDALPYGYLWWLLDSGAYAALGDSGNAIYVNPKEQIVIAIAAHFKPGGKLVTELIDGHILPQIL
jgi:CubicO group peptidase (beta-lactamase class C family)